MNCLIFPLKESLKSKYLQTLGFLLKSSVEIYRFHLLPSKYLFSLYKVNLQVPVTIRSWLDCNDLSFESRFSSPSIRNKLQNQCIVLGLKGRAIWNIISTKLRPSMILNRAIHLEIFFAAVSATLEVKLGERKTKPSTLGFYLPTASRPIAMVAVEFRRGDDCRVSSTQNNRLHTIAAVARNLISPVCCWSDQVGSCWSLWMRTCQEGRWGAGGASVDDFANLLLTAHNFCRCWNSSRRVFTNSGCFIICCCSASQYCSCCRRAPQDYCCCVHCCGCVGFCGGCYTSYQFSCGIS